MLATLRKFPATFYVANTMEIFERMAWYGFWIPFPLYLTAARSEGGVGLGDVERGVIQGVGTFILYLLPVVTGAFGDKFGFKRTFLLAYLVMIPGYFLLGRSRATPRSSSSSSSSPSARHSSSRWSPEPWPGSRTRRPRRWASASST